jgi:hypothetical protein
MHGQGLALRQMQWSGHRLAMRWTDCRPSEKVGTDLLSALQHWLVGASTDRCRELFYCASLN